MKTIIKFLGAALAAIALAFILSSAISRPVHAQFYMGGGNLNNHSISPVKTFTVVAGAATVVDPSITSSSIIDITIKTPGGTVAAQWIPTITPGTGFTVAGGASDTSVYNYVVTN
jgi:hypothetical protein